MRPQELVKLVKDTPFRPFRIRMSDGEAYDVLHPEMIIVERSWVTMYRYDKSGVAERIRHLSLLHIVDVEMLESESRKAG